MDRYEINHQLGREFLTWLWYATETGDGEFELGTGRVGLMVDEEVVLSEDLGEPGIDILRAPDVAVSGEARAALLSGKKASQLKMSMARDADEWLFTLNERLHCRSVRLPVSDAEHPADMFKDQMDAVETLGAVIDELYGEFVVKRLSSAWPAELKRIRGWIADK